MSIAAVGKNQGRPDRPWFVYMVRCVDGSLYTGITTDPVRREEEHNHDSNGARYTRGRRPVRLVYQEEAATRSAALQREIRIKKLSTRAKRALVKKGSASTGVISADGEDDDRPR